MGDLDHRAFGGPDAFNADKGTKGRDACWTIYRTALGLASGPAVGSASMENRHHATEVMSRLMDGADQPAGAIASAAMQTERSGPLKGRCVLLVEDEAVVAIDAKIALELAGAKVVGPADSLGQGFHYLQSQQFDCALLDVNLNSLVVFGLADALIERGIPVVFMSGEPINNFPLQYRSLRLVSKPCTTGDLVTAVRDSIVGEPANAEHETRRN